VDVLLKQLTCAIFQISLHEQHGRISNVFSHHGLFLIPMTDMVMSPAGTWMNPSVMGW
jgi:hypothetical protein